MAAVARHDMRDGLRQEAGSVAAMLIGLLRPTSAIAASRDAATARSLASVGLLGLFGLPVLMLASLLLRAPLAGPAAISLGYLAAAAALERGRPRRAAGWTFAVLTGLVLWMLIALAVAGQAPSGAGLAAIALAPLFAAAPTVAGRLVQRGRRDDVDATPSRVHGSPGAQTDRNGGSAEPDADRERARAAQARAVPAREATAASGPMRAAASRQPHSAPSPVESRPPCDLDDAIGFALRHLGPQARARGITLSPGAETPILAAGDRQLCRKLVMAIVREALSASRPRAEIRIATRAAKGFVLLQVTSTAPAGSGRADWIAPPPVRDLAEAIGASLVFERSGDTVAASLRLAPAGARMRQSPGA